MNNFYEKNIEIIEKLYPDIAEMLKQGIYKEQILEMDVENDHYTMEPYELVVEDGESEYPVFYGKRGNKSLYLSSPYDGEAYENKWMEQFEDAGEMEVFHFFGMTRIGIIKRVVEAYPKAVVVIYEPCGEVFRQMLQKVDLSFLTDRVYFVINEFNEEKLYEHLHLSTHYEALPNTRYFCMPNYEQLFIVEYKHYRFLLSDRANATVLDRNMQDRFSDALTRNYRENIRHIVRSYDLDKFVKDFPDGKPAIIVSAGPSLNKNIEELKNAKGKSFIIATDTALKPLINHGIMPDVAVTVDPDKPLLLFEKEEIKQLPLVMLEYGNSNLLKDRTGKVFFSMDGYSVFFKKFENMEKEVVMLETGGSVANNAFSLASACGCDPVILIGQDLAITGSVTHADGTFEDKMKVVDTSTAAYLDVEDIYGNTVRTRKDFYHYLKWFEKIIREINGRIEVVDATEGGARIHGTTIMTLKEAIEKYCVEDLDIDGLMDRAEKMFTPEEIASVDEEMMSIPDKLQHIKKKLKEGIGKFEEAEFYVKRNEMGRKLKDLVAQIGELTDYLEEEKVMSFIRPSMFAYEQTSRRKSMGNKMENNDDIFLMLEDGKENLETTLKAIEELEPDFEEMVRQTKIMQEKE